MIPTSMVLHQWLRINGMITPDATKYPSKQKVVVNEPLLVSPKKPVVAEMTTL